MWSTKRSQIIPTECFITQQQPTLFYCRSPALQKCVCQRDLLSFKHIVETGLHRQVLKFERVNPQTRSVYSPADRGLQSGRGIIKS